MNLLGTIGVGDRDDESIRYGTRVVRGSQASSNRCAATPLCSPFARCNTNSFAFICASFRDQRWRAMLLNNIILINVMLLNN